MPFFTKIFLFLCCLVCFAACSPDGKSEENGETRPIGPTSDGFFIVEATEGLKAELNFYDRTPPGELSAKSRDGQTFKFPEERLTAKSIKQLHAFKTKEALLSVNLKEITSHTGSTGTTRVASIQNGEAKLTNKIGGTSGASGSHIVEISTTSPFDREIVVETYYTSGDGYTKSSQRTQTLTLRNDKRIVFEISGSNTTSSIHPVVIVKDKQGNILDFETKNIKLLYRLKEMR